MSKSNEDADEIPRPTTLDRAHGAGKAALDAVPFVGSILSELFTQCVAAPIEKRRDEFLRDLLERIAELEGEERVTMNSLESNMSFQTAFVQAVRASDAATEKEKRQALRNAVINSACGSIDATNQHMFIRLVDELTAAHLVLLRVLNHPANAIAARNGTLSGAFGASFLRVIELAAPELASDDELIDQLMRDLEARGLSTSFGLRTTMTGHGLLERRTTKRGKLFIEFITEPHSDAH